jgi:hypothetical protein
MVYLLRSSGRYVPTASSMDRISTSRHALSVNFRFFTVPVPAPAAGFSKGSDTLLHPASNMQATSAVILRL